MKVLVTWYRDSGKWYAAGEVEVDNDAIAKYDGTFERQIMERQKVMQPGSFDGEYYITIQNIGDDFSGGFAERLYKPGTMSYKYGLNAGTMPSRNKLKEV